MQPIRLLVAIRNDAEREDIVRRLTAAGHRVVFRTGDGESAWHWAEELKPEVAVVDCRLNPDGRLVAEKIQKTNHVSVVLLASPDDYPEAEQSAQRGMTCLLKPVDSDQLCLAVLAAAADRKRHLSLMQRAATAERRLADRERIERAKGLLMEKEQLTEAQAYDRLRRLSMKTRKTMGEVAEIVLLSVQMRSS